MTQDYGIVPPTGAYGTSWPSHPVMPQGIHGGFSSAGWTNGNEGFVQQTGSQSTRAHAWPWALFQVRRESQTAPSTLTQSPR